MGRINGRLGWNRLEHGRHHKANLTTVEFHLAVAGVDLDHTHRGVTLQKQIGLAPSQRDLTEERRVVDHGAGKVPGTQHRLGLIYTGSLLNGLAGTKQ